MIGEMIYRRQLRRFMQPDVVEGYHRWMDVSPAEMNCLSSINISGKRVLDLGCGSGRMAPIVTSLGGFYMGIDQSRAMIEVARKLYPDNVFEHGDILSSRYSGYDVVLLMHNTLGGFFPLSNRRRVLSVLRGALASGGILIFSSHVNNGPFDVSHRSMFDWPLKIFRSCRGGGYALQRYHGRSIVMFRSTAHYLSGELSAYGFNIDLRVPDDSRSPADWVYFRAILTNPV